MDIDTKDDEKKKAPKQAEAKNGFLQNLIESIFKSVENVNLSTIIEYKDKKGEIHNFKDGY